MKYALATMITLIVYVLNLHSQPIDLTQKGPLGGGDAITFTPGSDTYATVSNLNELNKALDNRSVSLIYIPDGTVLTVSKSIRIERDDVVIFSDRGKINNKGKTQQGALLVINNPRGDGIFEVTGNNARISGLRFESSDIQSSNYGIRFLAQPQIFNHKLSVDNCEMYGFGYAAIQLNGNEHSLSKANALIHHNHIHHNNRSGFGYGIVLIGKNIEASIYRNHFDENRHSVAAQGKPGESYSASENFSVNNHISSEYDMHGFSDFNKNDCEEMGKCNPRKSCNIAGERIVISNNCLINCKYLFGLRGIPTDQATVSKNLSNNNSVFYTLWRGWFGEPCSTNYKEQIQLDKNDWKQYRLNASFTDSKYSWYSKVSWSGVNSWTPLSFYFIGGRNSCVTQDFDGNGIDDLWYVDENGTSFLSKDGTDFFRQLNTAVPALNNLLFGDFNGDNKTDIVYADGTYWKISWSGKSPWEILAKSGYKKKELMTGDFDGDGKTDILLADGKHWKVSWSGKSSWKTLAKSKYEKEDLMSGDFNGDGKADILLTDGTRWRVSFSAKTCWKTVAKSEYEKDRLISGDFNGDGKTDLLLTDGTHWRVSWSARSSWETLAKSGFKKKDLITGNFNGDSRTDIVLKVKI